MDFERFTRRLFPASRGSYTKDELALLQKEAEVSRAFRDSEKFVKKETGTLQLFLKFMDLRLNTRIKTEEIPAIDRELKDILADLKEERLKTLDNLGPKAPSAPASFQNHHPDALVGEIRTYLATRKNQKYDPDPLQSGFVIHLNLANGNNKESFGKVIMSGAKVLWTLDVEHILSIGDPRSAKHSVVAVGKDVKAAGIAQLKIDEKEDMYRTVESYKKRVIEYQQALQKAEKELDKQDILANIEEMERSIEDLQTSLGQWTPKQDAEPIVILDFDSGHYTPSKAWGDAVQGWNDAGFKVEWSRDARHV